MWKLFDVTAILFFFISSSSPSPLSPPHITAQLHFNPFFYFFPSYYSPSCTLSSPSPPDITAPVALYPLLFLLTLQAQLHFIPLLLLTLQPQLHFILSFSSSHYSPSCTLPSPSPPHITAPVALYPLLLLLTLQPQLHLSSPSPPHITALIALYPLLLLLTLQPQLHFILVLETFRRKLYLFVLCLAPRPTPNPQDQPISFHLDHHLCTVCH